MRICVFCGETVTSTVSTTDFCRYCFYVGIMHEQRTCEHVLGRIRRIPGVRGASVRHTGGGCFNIAVDLDDGRFLTPSIAFMDEGQVWVEPGFPMSPEEKWGMVVSESEEAWAEWDESKLYIPQELWDENGLVKAIRLLAQPIPIL